MFKSKSLDGILSAFTKVQTDLTEFVTRTESQRASHLEEAAFHAERAEFKSAEVDRAQSVMAKINDLIS